GLDEFVTFARWPIRDAARGPAVPTRPPVMVRGEAVWPVVCATLVRDIQAKMPEDDDEPDDEPEDKPDDESEDDPGTLYFGQEDGRTVPTLPTPNITPQPLGGVESAGRRRFLCDKVTYPRVPAPVDGAGVPPLGLSGSPPIKTSILPRGGSTGHGMGSRQGERADRQRR